MAVSIVIDGSPRSPRICHNGVIDLSDPLQPETRQPYHAAMGKLEANTTELKRRKASVQRTTEKSIVDLLEWCINSGYAIDRAGVMVGSMIDPDSIANSHIRAHALEGQLFRTMLEAALEARGIRCMIFREHDTYAKAAKHLRQPLGQIKRTLVDLGRSVNGPWRMDQKLAALAAWMVL